MVLGTEKILMALMMSLLVSGPVSLAAGAELSLTWNPYTDTANGTFVATNYDMVGMCSENDGTFKEIGRVSPPVSPIKFSSTSNPGTAIKCFIYAYNKVGKVSSENTPIVEGVVPFVKPATPGTPSLSVISTQ